MERWIRNRSCSCQYTDGNVAITGASVKSEKMDSSVVTYTGSTASGALTVGHGLNKKPSVGNNVNEGRRLHSDWIIGHAK